MAATGAYIGLLAIAGVFTMISFWVPAIIAALIALGLAFRYELRWMIDHTSLTQHKPRKIPPSPRSLRDLTR